MAAFAGVSLLEASPAAGKLSARAPARKHLTATIRRHRCEQHKRPQWRQWRQPGARDLSVRASADAAAEGQGRQAAGERDERQECLRCGALYTGADNSPTACRYHGHMTGDRGLYALAPPHQGVDGEWAEASGVIVYVWNGEGERPNTGRANWKERWTCCGVYGEDATPCRRGWHVSYSDGATRF